MVSYTGIVSGAEFTTFTAYLILKKFDWDQDKAFLELERNCNKVRSDIGIQTSENFLVTSKDGKCMKCLFKCKSPEKRRTVETPPEALPSIHSVSKTAESIPSTVTASGSTQKKSLNAIRRHLKDLGQTDLVFELPIDDNM